MANKRILDLAKDLGVTADDVQRAAVSCGVAAESPTASLDGSDVVKVKAALKSNEKKSAGASKTLTLGKPLSLGGKGSGESGSHSVEVSVRRRRSRGAAVAVAPKPTLKPADQARQAVETSAEQKKVAPPVVSKPTTNAEPVAKKVE
ncbi:MAG: translation initiation factor IF-2, partial [Ghiorsea sp.]|nr:translation initiation factor IF-2 [Ghiorsea sp.]